MSEMTLEEGLAYFKRLLFAAEANVEQLKRDIAVVEEQIKQEKQNERDKPDYRR